MSMITSAALAAYVNSEVPADLTELQVACDAAEGSIFNALQRQVVVAGAATMRSYEPTNSESLRIHDCTTVTNVTVAGGTADPTTYRLFPLNSVSWAGEQFPFEEIRHLYGAWGWFAPQYTLINVTATWGWQAIPAAISEAALLLAKDIWQMRDIRAGVAGFDGFGAVRVRENSTVVHLLRPYKRAEAYGLA